MKRLVLSISVSVPDKQDEIDVVHAVNRALERVEIDQSTQPRADQGNWRVWPATLEAEYSEP